MIHQHYNQIKHFNQTNCYIGIRETVQKLERNVKMHTSELSKNEK